MLLILTLVSLYVLVAFPLVRCVVFHPLLLIFYAVHDSFRWLKRRQFNLCFTGQIVAYTGLFGRGKTLSAVHKVSGLYRHFDGKKVWCGRRKKIVTQKIKILSNVELKKVPYEQLVSLQQIVQLAKGQEKIDNEADTLTSIIVLGDEFSVQLNSRNFRNNIDPLFLNSLLTCRHYHLSIFYTAQRFGQVDALLRQVTSYVVECEKVWRFERLSYFDAWELENATNPRLITPYARACWFVRQSDYEAYDTLAVVEDLDRRVSKEEMMSPQEILDLQRNQGANMEAVSKPSRRWLRVFGGRKDGRVGK